MQLTVPFGPNPSFPAFEFVLWGDISYGAVKALIVAVVDIARHHPSGLLQGKRGFGTNTL